MKIYPVNSLPKNNFRSNIPLPVPKPPGTKLFLEGAGTAAAASIPMFMYLYLCNIIERIMGMRKNSE